MSEISAGNEIMPSVQALVNRMGTNPDDFYNGKFKHTLIDIEEFASGQPTRLFWFLNDAEKALLTESAKELVRKKWHETVMTDIFKEDVSREEQMMALKNLVQKGILQPTGHWTDPRALYGQREDLIRVGACEDGVNKVHTLSFAQRINGALNKLVGK